jgi:hypothetical protein
MLGRIALPVALLAILIIPGVVEAQTRIGGRAPKAVKGERQRERAIDVLQHSLNLRPDQVTQLKSLLDARQTELVSLRDLKQQAAANPNGRKAAKQEIHSVRKNEQAAQERFSTAFKGMLTSDQLNAYENMVAAADKATALRSLRLIEGQGDSTGKERLRKK